MVGPSGLTRESIVFDVGLFKASWGPVAYIRKRLGGSILKNTHFILKKEHMNCFLTLLQ